MAERWRRDNPLTCYYLSFSPTDICGSFEAPIPVYSLLVSSSGRVGGYLGSLSQESGLCTTDSFPQAARTAPKMVCSTGKGLQWEAWTKHGATSLFQQLRYLILSRAVKENIFELSMIETAHGGMCTINLPPPIQRICFSDWFSISECGYLLHLAYL